MALFRCGNGENFDPSTLTVTSSGSSANVGDLYMLIISSASGDMSVSRFNTFLTAISGLEPVSDVVTNQYEGCRLYKASATTIAFTVGTGANMLVKIS